MARDERRTAPRSSAVERERRERERRERARRRASERSEARAARPERATRSARGEGSGRAAGGGAGGRATGGGAAVRVRERHEGMFGWIARNVREAPSTIASIPDAIVRALRGFAMEVVAVLGGIGRTLLSVVPGSSRVAGAGRTVVGRTVAGRTVAGRAAARGSARQDDGAGALPDMPRARARTRTPIDPARRARLRLRLRIAGVVVALAAVVTAWVVVPSSDAFRIRHLEVTGTSAVGDLEVRLRVDELLGDRTVFTVDEEAIARRIEELPFVRDVRVERHLPGGLQLHVREYRPLALGYADGKYWLLARDGRVLAKARRDEWSGRIPVVTIQDDSIKAGDRVGDEPTLRLLASRISGTRITFETIKMKDQAIVATIASGENQIEVRFGRPTALRQKLMAAESMLAYAARKDLEPLYVDVTVPGKPAFCPRSEVACGMPRGPQETAARAGATGGTDAAAGAAGDVGASRPLTDGADQLAADDPNG